MSMRFQRKISSGMEKRGGFRIVLLDSGGEIYFILCNTDKKCSDFLAGKTVESY
jgi:hypothetical protein